MNPHHDATKSRLAGPGLADMRAASNDADTAAAGIDCNDPGIMIAAALLAFLLSVAGIIALA